MHWGVLHCTALLQVATFHCTILAGHFSVHYCKLQECTISGRQERQSSCRQQSGCSFLSHTLFLVMRMTMMTVMKKEKRRRKKKETKKQTIWLLPSSLTLSFSWRWGWEGWWKWTNEKTYNLVAGWWYLWRYSPFLFADNKPIWEENKWESLTLGALPTKGQLLRRVLAGHPGG